MASGGLHDLQVCMEIVTAFIVGPSYEDSYESVLTASSGLHGLWWPQDIVPDLRYFNAKPSKNFYLNGSKNNDIIL